MEKPPTVPTNTQLNDEIKELWNKVTQLSYEVNSLRLEQEKLKRRFDVR